jgi:hypothetical protein
MNFPNNVAATKCVNLLSHSTLIALWTVSMIASLMKAIFFLDFVVVLSFMMHLSFFQWWHHFQDRLRRSSTEVMPTSNVVFVNVLEVHHKHSLKSFLDLLEVHHEHSLSTTHPRALLPQLCDHLLMLRKHVRRLKARRQVSGVCSSTDCECVKSRSASI